MNLIVTGVFHVDLKYNFAELIINFIKCTAQTYIVFDSGNISTMLHLRRIINRHTHNRSGRNKIVTTFVFQRQAMSKAMSIISSKLLTPD